MRLAAAEWTAEFQDSVVAADPGETGKTSSSSRCKSVVMYVAAKKASGSR